MSHSTNNDLETDSSRQIFTPMKKIGWGIASLGTAIISNTYAGLYLFFYQDYMGLGENFMYWGQLIYAIWNAFNDPLFGFLSDNSRSKKGRRIPFMRYTAPFLALTFIALWLVPSSLSEVGVFIWMLIGILLYDSAYTIIGLVYSALLPEITEDNNIRGQLSTISSLFGLLGTIIGSLIPGIFATKMEQGDPQSFYLFVIVIAVFGAFFTMITTYAIKERPEFTKIDAPVPLLESIKLTFKSKSFLILVAGNFMSILMSSLLLGSLIYLSVYVLGADHTLTLVPLFVGIIIGVIVINPIAKKLGYVQTQQVFALIAGIPLILLTFVPNIIMYPCLFIAGFGLAGPQVLTNILFAQVSDEDEMKCGVRREAMFFGVNALLTKPAQSIAVVIVTGLLSMANFVKQVDGVSQFQPFQAITNIRIFIGLIPGICMLLEAIILQFYPLRGKYLEDVNDKVLQMHEKKYDQLKQMS
ncbi:MFS transporter [Candidatus Lokiarchaeum ossiferum]|uniref:MFS transporter n=1 Tax=Candidatus Lokiarchaeum ossiferum TaxID=2951803 RepID=UPI00352C1341